MRLRFQAKYLASFFGLSLLVLGYPHGLATAQTPQTTQTEGRYAIYELEPTPALKPADIERIAPSFGLEAAKPVQEPTTRQQFFLYRDKEQTVRLVFQEANGYMAIFPNFHGRETPAPSAEDAVRLAQGWADKNNILRVAGQGILSGEVTTTGREDVSKGEKPGNSVDVIRTVHFYRQLDGLRVFGKNSIFSVDVGSEGVVGANFTMRSILPGQRIPTQIISPDQALEDFHRRYDAEIEQMQRTHPDFRFEMGRPQLIYYEQGQRYVQPVYRFIFRFVGPKGVAGDFNRLVPASVKPPEPILSPTSGQPPKELPPPRRTAGNAPQTAGPDPVLLGAYIINNSESGWLNDGWAFLTNFQVGNSVGQIVNGFPPAQISQNYWDADWLWEPDGSIPDNSQYYIGSVNFGVHEGHGNMWETATIGDWSQVINLPGITGYGAATGKGEITNYLLWKGCAIIPAPSDPYCADYQSPANWSTVWFTIFQGMRGAYGFRTEMWIDDEAGGPFALAMGLGVPNMNAWFSATDNSQWDHDSTLNGTDGCPFPSDPGPEYGDAVMVCGHENDTAYNTGNEPPPSCLTIWWQHK
jgi:hypothetical protein